MSFPLPIGEGRGGARYELIKSLTSVFQDIDYILKALCTSVVRIRNVVNHLLLAKVRHTMDFPVRLKVGRQVIETIDVCIIHADDEVEMTKVTGTNGPREMYEPIAMTGCMGLHARVGTFTFMIANESGGIDFKLAGLTSLLHNAAHDGLSHRTATNVAQTNKEDARRTTHDSVG